MGLPKEIRRLIMAYVFDQTVPTITMQTCPKSLKVTTSFVTWPLGVCTQLRLEGFDILKRSLRLQVEQGSTINHLKILPTQYLDCIRYLEIGTLQGCDIDHPHVGFKQGTTLQELTNLKRISIQSACTQRYLLRNLYNLRVCEEAQARFDPVLLNMFVCRHCCLDLAMIKEVDQDLWVDVRLVYAYECYFTCSLQTKNPNICHVSGRCPL